MGRNVLIIKRATRDTKLFPREKIKMTGGRKNLTSTLEVIKLK
jgi:hypothetical protein